MQVTKQEQYIEALYVKHQLFLQSVCRKKVGNDASYNTLIEDSIQETFLLAYQCYDTLQAHPNVRAWLVKTCLNRLIPHVQQQRRQKNAIAYNDAVLSVADQNSSMDDFVRTLDVERFKTKLVTTLTELEIQVFQLYFIDDKTMQETAMELNISMNQIRVAIRRIRQKAKVLQGELC